MPDTKTDMTPEELREELEGVKRQVISLPRWLGWTQAYVLEHLPGQPMTRDQFRSLLEDNVCTEPFPAILGVEPTPLEAVVPSYIGPEETRWGDLYKYRASARRHD